MNKKSEVKCDDLKILKAIVDIFTSLTRLTYYIPDESVVLPPTNDEVATLHYVPPQWPLPTLVPPSLQ